MNLIVSVPEFSYLLYIVGGAGGGGRGWGVGWSRGFS